MAITWDEGKGEHLARHGVTIEQANEAYYEPNAVMIKPDYASTSGRGVRTVGYSASFGDLLSVLTMRDDNGVTHGNTAFRAKRRDRRYYEEE